MSFASLSQPSKWPRQNSWQIKWLMKAQNKLNFSRAKLYESKYRSCDGDVHVLVQITQLGFALLLLTLLASCVEHISKCSYNGRGLRAGSKTWLVSQSIQKIGKNGSES